MTSARHDHPGGERYEIVVHGVVGRAVCAALLPLRAATHHMTIIRVRLVSGCGLPDLVAALDASGVPVARVELLE